MGGGGILPMEKKLNSNKLHYFKIDTNGFDIYLDFLQW